MKTERKLAQSVLLVIAVVVLLPLVVFAQGGEQGVRSATIDATLQPDGSLLVTEELQYDLGPVPQTGFVRRLITPSNGKIAVNSVFRDDLKDQFATTQAGKTKRIIIGTDGVEITGEHSYEISYTANNTLVRGDENAQLTWTVVDDVGITAENITIKFSSPLTISNVACRIEPDQQGCPVKKTDAGFQATLDELSSGKSLVLQATLPVDQLSYNPPTADDESAVWLWLSVFGVILAGSCFAVYWWLITDNQVEEYSIPDRIDSLS